MHAFLTGSYWAEGRPRETVGAARRASAQRVVGLYHEGAQVGFCRAVSDDASVTYLADVYVLPEHRGRGLGEELVREMVDNGPYADAALAARTRATRTSSTGGSASGSPGERLMERPPA